MLATPKDKRKLYLAMSLCDGLEDNNMQQIIMLLMTKGADPNVLVPNYGITPFHLVVGNDSESFAESVTKLFLQQSGNPNVKSVDGLTPVHVAAAWGRSKVLQLLLASGGDPLSIDNDGHSPFHYAFDGKYYEAIATLSEYCSSSTNDNDKPEVELAKVSVCNSNLLAEHQTLKNSVCDKNVAISTNISNGTDGFLDIGQGSDDVTRYMENAKRETKHVRHLNENCHLPDGSIAFEKDQPLADVIRNTETSNLSECYKFNSSPRAFAATENLKKRKRIVSEAVNRLCAPFTNSCIVNNRLGKHAYGDKSSPDNCSSILVSANAKKNVAYEHESLDIMSGSVNEYLGIIDKYCYHKFAHNDSNCLSYNKSPSKSYLDSRQNSCSKKKKKQLKSVPTLSESAKRVQRLSNIKMYAATNSVAKSDRKSLLTSAIEKYEDSLQYQDINITAQSTPKKEAKYLRSPCKSIKRSKCIHMQKSNIPNNFSLDNNSQNEIKSTQTNTSINLNGSFDTDVKLGFHMSPDMNTVSEVTQGRLFKSSFAINLNNSKYDEDEKHEDAFIFTKDHCPFDNLVRQGKKDQGNCCICENYALQLNTLGLCENCETFKWNDTKHPEECEKLLSVHKSDWPSILSQEMDLSENTVHNFAKNQLLCKHRKMHEKLHASGKEKGKNLSANSISVQSDFNSEGTRNKGTKILDVHRDQKWLSNTEDDSCNTSRMYTCAESSIISETYASVQQEYIYKDSEEGVVFVERRYGTPMSISEVIKGNGFESAGSNDLSIPRSTFSKDSSEKLPTMDDEMLRQKLVEMGDMPGPITATTKQVYLKRLINLKSKSDIYASEKHLANVKTKGDLAIIEPRLKFGKWLNNLPVYAKLEKNTFEEFINPDLSRRWREGTAKTCFNYLLLDSRVTQNLPNRNNLTEYDTWAIFLSAIFYIGKGKRSRPYSHLYDAFNAWILKDHNASSKKIKRILDMWNDGHGVVCLHIFQNTIPVEAYTREAVMIEALGINNLDNCKGGDYYGITARWSVQKKQKFGRYLLYKAMQIFMYEGERQLFPEHL